MISHLIPGSFSRRTPVGIIAAVVAAAVVALFMSVPTARASVAVTSASITNTDHYGHQVTKLDVNGNAVDAHDGMIAYFNGTYYLYGTSYSCGYGVQAAGTPFCGFKVYSSPDLMHWTDNGYVVPPSSTWQQRCAPPTYGCYRPHVIFNAATGQYVLWINSYEDQYGYHVFTNSSPTGQFAEVAQQPSGLGFQSGGTNYGDFDLFTDASGKAYIVYAYIHLPSHVWSWTSHTLVVQQLNATFTDAVGTTNDLGTSETEAPTMFAANGRYYVINSGTCTYCSSRSEVRTATDPLGTWSPPTTLTSDSCGGQTAFARALPTTSGTKTVMWASDRWYQPDVAVTHQGYPNQGQANYYWTTLTFDASGGVLPISCAAATTLPLAAGASLGAQAQPPGADQSSELPSSDGFFAFCDIRGGLSRSQAFTVGVAGTLQGIDFAAYQTGQPTSPLMVSVYRADDSGAPTGRPLKQIGVWPNQLGWADTALTLGTSIPVAVGDRLALVLVSQTSQGCYGWAGNDARPYHPSGGSQWVRRATGGVEMYSQGSTWVAEPYRNLAFTTTVR